MAGALVPEDDLYGRLEVAIDASPEAIELAWRALLKQHHPDVAGDTLAALERAKRINVAHDWLSDAGLRARYDRERLGLGAILPGRARTGVRHGRPPRAWPPQPPPRPAAARARRSTRPDLVRGEPAQRLERFLDRVTRLSDDELDRLAAAEPPPIAFLATIRRFVTPEAAAAFEAAEVAVAARVPRDRWAEVGLREGLLGVAAELVLSPFLDDTLAEPFRGRARDRLLRAWEASIDQPRYGPNGAEVAAVRARVATMTANEAATLVRASVGVPGDDRPWPPALDHDEDEALRISALLAARDVAAALRPDSPRARDGGPRPAAAREGRARDGAAARVHRCHVHGADGPVRRRDPPVRGGATGRRARGPPGALGERLDDRKASRPGSGDGEIRADAAGERPEAGDCLGSERVVDPGAAPLAHHPTGVAQHLEVMGDRGLADVAAVHEVAGADLVGVAQLAQDREPRRIRGGLEQAHVGIGLALHVRRMY